MISYGIFAFANPDIIYTGAPAHCFVYESTPTICTREVTPYPDVDNAVNVTGIVEKIFLYALIYKLIRFSSNMIEQLACIFQSTNWFQKDTDTN